jgi:hypothetical protein
MPNSRSSNLRRSGTLPKSIVSSANWPKRLGLQETELDASCHPQHQIGDLSNDNTCSLPRSRSSLRSHSLTSRRRSPRRRSTQPTSPWSGSPTTRPCNSNVTAAYPPNPCYARLGFQNSMGIAVGPSQSVILTAGQTASRAINGQTVPPAPIKEPGNRVELLPTVTPTSTAPSSCIATAEVIDNGSGRTLVGILGAVSCPPTHFWKSGFNRSSNGAFECRGVPTHPIQGYDRFHGNVWKLADGATSGESSVRSGGVRRSAG